MCHVLIGLLEERSAAVAHVDSHGSTVRSQICVLASMLPRGRVCHALRLCSPFTLIMPCLSRRAAAAARQLPMLLLCATRLRFR